MIELHTGELFCGAGGLGLGFVLADHPHVRFCPSFAIDADSDALKSYRYNMGWLKEHARDVLPKTPHAFVRDVERLNTKALIRLSKLNQGKLDLLLGGPPCQGFSNSNKRGKQKSKAERNRLTKVFLDKLQEFKPRMFLIENVQGVSWTDPTEDMSGMYVQENLFSEDIASISSVQEFLIQRSIDIGYHVWHGILNAVNFGVPQHRMRFFLFGVDKNIVADKKDVNLTTFIEQLKGDEIYSVNDAISDLPLLENGEKWNGDDYNPGNSRYVSQLRRFMKSADLYDHFTTNHKDYVIDRFRNIPEGSNWESVKDMMSNYKNVDNTHSNIYRRLKGSDPANTISHYRKSMIIHPTQHRGLSFREACRLQSFPDWARFYGSQDQQQQQLANAVPPLMAIMIAKAIASWWYQQVGETT